jgi:hypothetical protein
MGTLIETYLKRGSLTDVDEVSGMSLIHFAAMSGAAPFGDDAAAAKTVGVLVQKVRVRVGKNHLEV